MQHRVGNRVRSVRGPYKGLIGEVTLSDRHLAVIKLPNDQEVAVPQEDLEPVTGSNLNIPMPKKEIG